MRVTEHISYVSFMEAHRDKGISHKVGEVVKTGKISGFNVLTQEGRVLEIHVYNAGRESELMALANQKLKMLDTLCMQAQELDEMDRVSIIVTLFGGLSQDAKNYIWKNIFNS